MAGEDIYDAIDQQAENQKTQAAAAAAASPPAKEAAAKATETKDEPSGLKRSLEIAGLGALGTAGAVAGARYPALREALARLSGFVSRHPVLGAGTVGAVAGGAGAVPHAVQTGNPEDIAIGAAIGAPTAITGRLVAAPLARRLAQIGGTAPERAVASTVLADNADAKAASARLKQLAQSMRATARGANPNQETVADVLGPQSQALTKDALATPSPQAREFADQLATRQAETTDRVGEAVNQSLKPTAYDAAEKQLIQSLGQNSRPLYQQAFSQFPSVNSDIFNSEILNTKEGQAAAKWAADQWKKVHPGQPIGPITPGGMVSAPALEYHQLVKEYLDGEVAKTRKAVVSGSANKKELNTISGLRDRYVDDLDQATGGDQSPYAAARAQYSSDAKVLDSLHQGRDDFDTMTPVELRARMMQMGTGLSAEKDAFLSGVAENLMRKLGKTRVAPGGTPSTNPVMKIAGDPDTQAKIAALFDNPREAQAFLATLERESEMFQRTKGFLGSAAQAPVAAVQPKSSPLATVAKSGAHSINPKLAALRAAIDTLKPSPPYPGIVSVVRKTGAEGAGQLDQLSDAVRRLQSGLTLGDTAGLGAATIGGGAAGAGAAALADKEQ